MVFSHAAGCSDNSSQSDTSANTVGSQKSLSSFSQSDSSNQNAAFNAEKVFKNIRLNDTVLPNACSLSDLDSEYSFGENYFLGDEKNPGRAFGNILHDGVKALSFDIYSVPASDQSDPERLAKVRFDILSQSREDIVDSHAILSVDGISIGDKVDDVTNAFGAPESLANGESAESYTYVDPDDSSKKIQFDFSDKTVTAVTIFYSSDDSSPSS